MLYLYFLGNNPSWRCVIQPNATSSQNVTRTTGNDSSAVVCQVAGDIKVGDDYYDARCNMDRSLWEYSKDKDYSIVTEVYYGHFKISVTFEDTVLWVACSIPRVCQSRDMTENR